MLSVTLCWGKLCSKRQLVKAVCASQHRYMGQKRPCAAARTDGDPHGVQQLSATRALPPAIQTHQLSKGHSWPAWRARPGMNLPSQAGSAAGGTHTPELDNYGRQVTHYSPANTEECLEWVTPERLGFGLNSPSLFWSLTGNTAHCREPVLHLPAKSRGSRVVFASARHAAT